MRTKNTPTPEPPAEIEYGNGIDGTPYTQLLTFSSLQVAMYALKGLTDDERKSIVARVKEKIADYLKAGKFNDTLTVPLTDAESEYAVAMAKQFRYEQYALPQAAYRDLVNVRKIGEPEPIPYREYRTRYYVLEPHEVEIEEKMPTEDVTAFITSEAFTSRYDLVSICPGTKAGEKPYRDAIVYSKVKQ